MPGVLRPVLLKCRQGGIVIRRGLTGQVHVSKLTRKSRHGLGGLNPHGVQIDVGQDAGERTELKRS